MRKSKSGKIFISSLEVIGMIAVLLTLEFFLPFPKTKNLDYLQGNQVHYIGSSDVTPEQFTDLMMIKINAVTSYEKEDSGLVRVEYDFYAPSGKTYLTTVAYSVWDMPMFHYFYSLNLAWFFLGMACVLFVMFAYLKGYTGGSFGNKTMDSFFDKVNSKTLRVLDGLNKGNFDSQKVKILDGKKVDVDSVNGIVAVRTWRTFWGSSLRSKVKHTVWEGRVMVADKMPEKDNTSGVYALRLGATTVNRAVGLVMGIVEMTGRYEYHGDGVIRAERCEIKVIICYDALQNRGRRISAKYGVPICFASDPLKTYHDWLFSKNGLECLLHNYGILGQPSVFDEVQNMLKGG